VRAAAAAVIALAVVAGPANPGTVRSTGAAVAAPDWPAVTNQTRPWTRWWWMGSAVDAAGLTTELEELRAAGLGGVEITPIYRAAGPAARTVVPYLSEDWMRRLAHTLAEARRLDLGVDMATGTGWPFGGPWVGPGEAARALSVRTWVVEGNQRLREPVRLDQAGFLRAIGTQPPADGAARRLQIADLKEPLEANPDLQALAIEQVRYPRPLPILALVAHSDGGLVVDLTSRIGADGTLEWTAPQGTWTLYGLFLGWHGKLVERAAPGGEGYVIDHFSRDAIRNYLRPFDRAFAGRPPSGLRAFFNDSYEVDDAQGQADATPGVLDEFQRRRGYDLRRHLPALLRADAGDGSIRVLADYRETISDLLLDTFTAEWRDWARTHGAMVRNQAHGSPANLLDLYAASDIPETEGTEIARALWATSAAHVAGRPLVAAEAATWLGEHFRATLADVRDAVDRFFLAGVNHIVYHGTAYSPRDDPWPGWLFYASVEFNSRNSWWDHFRALNEYVTRTQSFLQAGVPDQDVLVYYPFYDSLAVRGPARLAHFGNADPPAAGTAFEAAVQTLRQRGYTADFISDRQLASTRVAGGRLVTGGGGSYKALVLPASRFLPLETFEHIARLAQAGAVVVTFKGMADEVSGYVDLDRRRARLRELRGTARMAAADDAASLERLLEGAGVLREALVDRGLQFTRRRHGDGRYYFIRNVTTDAVNGWIPLGERAPAAVIFDPMTGRRGDARTRRSEAGALEVFLAIPRGGSLIVATTPTPAGVPFPLFEPAGAPITIGGPWRLRFVAGGPEIPAERTIAQLSSWTTLGGEEVRRFSGTAVYTARFAGPRDEAPAWGLDLGRVFASARVRLNGRDVGTSIGPSFRLTIDPAQLAGENTLEVEVSNLMANRIAAMDKAGVPWRKFSNVNFPARLADNRGPDGLFSAAKWEPLDSGLLGPVTLTRLR
jgi:glycosyl hydrolase family 106( putative alpha-L-rhamnosidase)